MPETYQNKVVLDYLVRKTPIYEFFALCELTGLQRNVLDCGAGGKYPPLALFHDRGYEAFGLEISEPQLAKAQAFCRENKVNLNFLRADMRRIPFDDESFSFVFAYESIFFLREEDIEATVKEIKRVLKPDGLCFVTFKSADDTDRRTFPKLHPVRTMLGSSGVTYHKDDEPEKYFNGFRILQKKKRVRETLVKGKKGRRAYLDYIAKKR